MNAKSALVIERAALSQDGDHAQLTAMVDGRELWFRVPASRKPVLRADPFLAAALLPAMRTGRPIAIDPSLHVSPALLAGISKLQTIFRFWFEWADPVGISGGIPTPAPAGDGIGALFSGGVDSSFTLLAGNGAEAGQALRESGDHGQSSRLHAGRRWQLRKVRKVPSNHGMHPGHRRNIGIDAATARYLSHPSHQVRDRHADHRLGGGLARSRSSKGSGLAEGTPGPARTTPHPCGHARLEGCLRKPSGQSSRAVGKRPGHLSAWQWLPAQTGRGPAATGANHASA